MAIYKTEPTKYHKEIITNFQLTGLELDRMKGVISFKDAKRRITGEGDETPYLENGEEVYENLGVHSYQVSDELAENKVLNINGKDISAQEVFQWISTWTDYKKGEIV